MTQKQKINWVEKFYRLICKMFGESSVSFMIHDINMKDLPTGWKTSSNRRSDGTSNFTTAHKEGLDITLFD